MRTQGQSLLPKGMRMKLLDSSVPSVTPTDQSTESSGSVTSDARAGIPSPRSSSPLFEDKGTGTPDFSPVLPPLPPGESWASFFKEIRSIGKKLSTLEKIEKTTDSLSKQITAVLERTADIEEVAKINAAGIADINEQVFPLKTVVEEQSRDIGKLKALQSVVEKQTKDIGKLKSTIEEKTKDIGKLKTLEATVDQHNKDLKGLKNLKENLTKATGRVVDEMRDLVVEQRKQMDAFQSSSKQINANTAQLVEVRVQQVKEEFAFKDLKRKHTRKDLIW